MTTPPSGGCRAGARTRSPLFWLKKEEMTEVFKPAGQVNQNRATSLAQVLDMPLPINIEKRVKTQRVILTNFEVFRKPLLKHCLKYI